MLRRSENQKQNKYKENHTMHSIVEMLKIKNKEHHENIHTGQKKSLV